MRTYRLAIGNNNIEIKANNKQDALKKANEIAQEEGCYATEWSGYCDFIAVFKSNVQNSNYSLVFPNKKEWFENEIKKLEDAKTKKEIEDALLIKNKEDYDRYIKQLTNDERVLYHNAVHETYERLHELERQEREERANYEQSFEGKREKLENLSNFLPYYWFANKSLIRFIEEDNAKLEKTNERIPKYLLVAEGHSYLLSQSAIKKTLKARGIDYKEFIDTIKDYYKTKEDNDFSIHKDNFGILMF